MDRSWRIFTGRNRKHRPLISFTIHTQRRGDCACAVSLLRSVTFRIRRVRFRPRVPVVRIAVSVRAELHVEHVVRLAGQRGGTFLLERLALVARLRWIAHEHDQRVRTRIHDRNQVVQSLDGEDLSLVEHLDVCECSPRPKPFSRAPNMMRLPLAKRISCWPFARRTFRTYLDSFGLACQVAHVGERLVGTVRVLCCFCARVFSMTKGILGLGTRAQAQCYMNHRCLVRPVNGFCRICSAAVDSYYATGRPRPVYAVTLVWRDTEDRAPYIVSYSAR